jgi:NTP pyrophosphatase (non-canonical NTP hydrolase)
MKVDLKQSSRYLAAYVAWATTKEAPIEDERLRLCHATTGLASEIGEYAGWWKKHLFQGQELNVEQAKKELGDICYYAAILVNYSREIVTGLPLATPVEDLTPEQVAQGERLNIEISILVSALNLALDVAYFKAGDSRRRSAFTCGMNVFGAVRGICEVHQWDFRDLLQENIDKLEKRFPSGYSNEHAMARMDGTPD